MSLNFYKALKYPIPLYKDYFLYQKKNNGPIQEKLPNNVFSRAQKNQYMEEYITHIDKYHRLYKSIPGISQIYLCNSITFNALHENSDIDLFIVAKKNRIWRAKFRATVLFTIFGLKRYGKNCRKKFCLSFLVTEDAQNIQNLLCKSGDVYLPYRLCHLVPLYSENKSLSEDIFEHNQWVTHRLPNYQKRATIYLGNKKSHGSSLFKNIVDLSPANRIISIGEKTIKNLRIPIIKWKNRINPESNKNIVLSKNTLKFHKDKRRQYYFLFKKQSKSQR